MQTNKLKEIANYIWCVTLGSVIGSAIAIVGMGLLFHAAYGNWNWLKSHLMPWL